MFNKRANLLSFQKQTLLPKSPNHAYVLISGPPFVNGSPHAGHAFNICIKDSICRKLRQIGYDISLLHGWDYHGEPIAKKIEANFEGDIWKDKITFLERCKQFGEESEKNFIKLYEELGIDISYWYSTNDTDYMKTELILLKELHNKKLLINQFRHTHVCFGCKTDLSFSELNESDEVEIDNIYRLYKICKSINVYLLVYTTTPYNLFFNQGIAYNRDLNYVQFKHEGRIIIALKEFAKTFSLKYEPFDVKKLESLFYEDTHDIYYGTQSLDFEKPIFHSDQVTEKGGGFLHLSAHFSSIDHGILLSSPHHKDPLISYLSSLSIDQIHRNYQIFVKNKYFNKDEASSLSIEILRREHLLFNDSINIPLKQTISCLTCWRCDKKVDDLLKMNYFIDIVPIKEATINNIGEFYEFLPQDNLTNMIKKRTSWCLSRLKPCGLFIPSWNCQTCGNHFIDNAVFDEYIRKFTDETSWIKLKVSSPKCIKCNSKKTEKDFFIADVWFDSGIASIYAKVQGLVPIIYLEGEDQNRGWWNSQAFLDTIFNNMNSKTIIQHSFICDRQGDKLSKSKNNYDVNIFDQFPSDIIRSTFLRQDIHSEVTFDREILEQTQEIYIKQRNHLYFLFSNANLNFNIEFINTCSIYEKYYISFIYLSLFKINQEWAKNYKFSALFQKINFFMFEYNNPLFFSFLSNYRNTDSFRNTCTILLCLFIREIESIYPYTFHQIMNQNKELHGVFNKFCQKETQQFLSEFVQLHSSGQSLFETIINFKTKSKNININMGTDPFIISFSHEKNEILFTLTKNYEENFIVSLKALLHHLFPHQQINYSIDVTDIKK